MEGRIDQWQQRRRRKRKRSTKLLTKHKGDAKASPKFFMGKNSLAQGCSAHFTDRIQALFSGWTHRIVAAGAAMESRRGFKMAGSDIARGIENLLFGSSQFTFLTGSDHLLVGLQVVEDQALWKNSPVLPRGNGIDGKL